jgi:peptidoglycan/LPS O-acetylase OafA/YrhL
MKDPWFDPNAFAWIPGTSLGVLGGTWGSLMGCLAPQGKGKSIVVGTGIALFLLSIAFLVLAIVAVTTGQPYGIWYGLLLPGLLGTFLIPSLLFVVRIRYREAELRKMSAMHLE